MIRENENKLNGLYFIKFTYYDEYRDKTVTEQCLVMAHDASEAIASIVKDYKYIDEITVKEWVSPQTGVDCIYLPNNQNIISAIENANDY